LAATLRKPNFNSGKIKYDIGFLRVGLSPIVLGTNLKFENLKFKMPPGYLALPLAEIQGCD